jgi:hypothetical protein
MMKGILFIMAVALASLITAPAFVGTVAATNQTSTDGGGTDTTDGTSTDGGGTDTTDGTSTDGGGTDTTDGTSTDGGANLTSTTYYKTVKAKGPSNVQEYKCETSSGKTKHIDIDTISVSVSRGSTPSTAEEEELGTSNWKGTMYLEGISSNYKKTVDGSISGWAHKKGSDKPVFSLSGKITEDTLCKAPPAAGTQSANLTSAELSELSEVGSTATFSSDNCKGTEIDFQKNKGASKQGFGGMSMTCSTKS